MSEISQRVLPHDAVAIGEVMPGGESIRMYASQGLGGGTEPFETPIRDRSLLTEPWDYRIFDDMSTHPTYAGNSATVAGMRSVLFVPVHFIGREAALEPSTLPAPVCTLNDLRYLEGQGVSVQSLGVTGRSFDELSETEREWEAMRSRQALEAALQVPIELFAFPRGDPGPEPVATGRMILRCGYRAAFACRGSANRLRDADRFRLARVTVGPNTDLSTALGERATRLA